MASPPPPGTSFEGGHKDKDTEPLIVTDDAGQQTKSNGGSSDPLSPGDTADSNQPPRKVSAAWSNENNVAADQGPTDGPSAIPPLKPAPSPETTSDEPSRHIVMNNHEANEASKFVSNYISTGRYTLLTFIPKNLFEQFSRVANLYFLLISALQLFTNLSPTGRWTTFGPLALVLFVTASKEAFEDYKRHKSDKEVNNRIARVLRGKEFEEILWKDVRVGDVLRVQAKEYIPADLILLSSSENNSICYVETSNLDGETNLKIHQAIEETGHLTTPDVLAEADIELMTELPNTSLYTFTGNLIYSGKTLSLGPKQVLLRGAMLRNCHWVYGTVIFTGDDSKLMQNSKDTPSKRSNVERKTNVQILLVFCLQMVLCTGSAIGRGLWAGKNEDGDMWFLDEVSSFATEGFYGFFTFLILYNNLIPISLYVSMELVKFAQAYLINQDLEMYYAPKDIPAQARTSNLNEELGQVEYVFSDKTGTLTRNQMEYRKCTVAGVAYGTDEDIPDALRSERKIDASYNFDDREFLSDLTNEKNEHADKLREFLRLLAVCHSVIPEDDNGTIVYQASSPDENALVAAAKELGYFFYDRTTSSVTVACDGEDQEFEILNVLEFNSTRKRMSVIARTPEGKIVLYCKGADTVIYKRLAPDQEYADVTLDHLRDFAAEGLRTLCVAYTELDEGRWREWNEIHAQALQALVDRDARLDEAAELIETDLILLGATAIEDKLQVGVPEAISKLAEAQIKLWVLTGDKMETAINIGFSCHLLVEDMQLHTIAEDNYPELKEEFPDREACVAVIGKALDDIRKEVEEEREQRKAEKEANKEKHGHHKSNGPSEEGEEEEEEEESEEKLAIVIDGGSLVYALHERNVTAFLELTTQCASVICCRVSPLQKAQVVDLARERLNAITLAIGDGANDVSMIQAAHVGIGISGEEGLQAARAADYSIAQFRFLVRLLLIHGRWSYRRVSTLICYSFYKNIALYLTQFWFIWFNGISGQSLYEGWTIALFNIAFANFPIMVHAVLEQDVSEKFTLQYPGLYVAGQQRKYFNSRVFWGWVVTAIYHSFALFFLVMMSLSHENYYSNGQSGGLYSTGTVLYSCVVVVVNLVIALETHFWTVWNHLAVWGSIAILFAYYFPYCLLWTGPIPIAPEMYFIIYKLITTPLFYFTIIMASSATILFDVMYKFLTRTYYGRTFTDVVQDLEVEAKKPKKKSDKAVEAEGSVEELELRKSVTTRRKLEHARDKVHMLAHSGASHTGFAFSESLGRADFVRNDSIVGRQSMSPGLPRANDVGAMAREHSLKVLR